jgi:hypothetical protein
MSSPGNKPDPNPMKFFEKDQPARESANTKEEAGQRAVEARYHELEKIADPQQREKAEKALRAHAEKTFGMPLGYIDKAVARQNRWEDKLHSLNEKNPLRAAGTSILNTLDQRHRRKISSMVLDSAHKSAAIITRAQKTSEKFRQRQAQNQPGKDIDREK